MLQKRNVSCCDTEIEYKRSPQSIIVASPNSIRVSDVLPLHLETRSSVFVSFNLSTKTAQHLANIARSLAYVCVVTYFRIRNPADAHILRLPCV